MNNENKNRDHEIKISYFCQSNENSICDLNFRNRIFSNLNQYNGNLFSTNTYDHFPNRWKNKKKMKKIHKNYSFSFSRTFLSIPIGSNQLRQILWNNLRKYFNFLESIDTLANKLTDKSIYICIFIIVVAEFNKERKFDLA